MSHRVMSEMFEMSEISTMFPIVAWVPMQVVFQPDVVVMPASPPYAARVPKDEGAFRGWTGMEIDSEPRRQCAEAFKKTTICKYFPNCRLGSACRFAHTSEELRARPQLTKTRMCAGYYDGRCRRPASECGFAHGKHDLKPREVPFYKDPPAGSAGKSSKGYGGPWVALAKVRGQSRALTTERSWGSAPSLPYIGC